MMKKHVFGLHGGIGNALFCLPAIKALAREGMVNLYVHGDYPMAELFSRCSYAESVVAVGNGPCPSGRKLCGQYAPTVDHGCWRLCGWPDGEYVYPHPEWAQIKNNAVGNTDREDVTDWVKDLQPAEKRYNIGLVPGCKTGTEWYRKRWPHMGEFANRLDNSGLRVIAFGLAEEINDADLKPWWSGVLPLASLPDYLASCELIVGTDSGVTHLASSIGVPCVVIYTATSTVKGEPLGPPESNIIVSREMGCAPCQSTPEWRRCRDWRCRDIPISRVAMAVHQIMDMDQRGGAGQPGRVICC